MQKTEILNEQVAWFAVERRHNDKDRRGEWRGGRRDSDWTENRPQGVLDQPPARAHWMMTLRRLVPGRAH